MRGESIFSDLDERRRKKVIAITFFFKRLINSTNLTLAILLSNIVWHFGIVYDFTVLYLGLYIFSLKITLSSITVELEYHK